jgi:hypothetical protein
MPAGRPTKLTRALVDKATEFDYKASGHAVPTIEGLSLFLAINRDTVREWASNPETPLAIEFSGVVSTLMATQALELVNGGLKGRFNAKIANMMLSKHGYVEKSESETKLTGQVSFVNDVPRPKGE